MRAVNEIPKEDGKQSQLQVESAGEGQTAGNADKSEHVLTLRQVSVTKGDFSLEDISFDVPRGCITGLVGKNGSGKTTLIKTILNIYEKDEGQVVAAGFDNREECAAKNRIGVVMPECTFFEEKSLVANGELLGTLYENFSMERYIRYLVRFGLKKEKEGSSYVLKALSAGQRVRFQLAFALAHEPELLLLDEPAANLDSAFRRKLLEALQEAVEEREIGVLMSTHLTADLDRIGDYIVLMDKGHILACESKEALSDAYPGLDVARILLTVVNEEAQSGREAEKQRQEKGAAKKRNREACRMAERNGGWEEEQGKNKTDLSGNPLFFVEKKIWEENWNKRGYYYGMLFIYLCAAVLMWLFAAPAKAESFFNICCLISVIAALQLPQIYASGHCMIGNDCLYRFAGFFPVTRVQFLTLYRTRRRKQVKWTAAVQLAGFFFFLVEMLVKKSAIPAYMLVSAMAAVFLPVAAMALSGSAFIKKMLSLWENGDVM